MTESNSIIIQTNVNEYVRSINKRLWNKIWGWKDKNTWEFYIHDEVIYRITMRTTEDLDNWIQDFNGDITSGRLKEHLSFTNNIMSVRI
jgi:hypothetical protein